MTGLRPLFSVLMLAVSLPLLASGDIALTEEQKTELEKWVGGRKVGEAQKCIYRNQSDDLVVISERIFLFGSSRNAKKIFINKTAADCSGALKLTKVFRRSSAARLCRGDMIVVVDAGMNMPKGSCKLNDFVPLTR